MTDAVCSQAERIRANAKKAQRQGRAGDALKLHILAAEAKTIKATRKP